jgi:alkanesulfonate monooxygenase SsuD/methylene tetrahydromethanopterin reductase-like flavin-dependent oxidoreductase (luciferase family)
MATAAERAGFDSVWVGDHYLYRGGDRTERGPWEAWTTLAAVAASTTRVQLGPLVACLAFHPPGVLARMAATVDEISGGRLILGVGAGWNEEEFRAFGLPFDHRASRFEESFEAVRRLLAGERVTLAGRYVRLDEAVLLPKPSRRPELMLGSNGDRLLATALPHVDAWNTWFDDYGNTPAGFEVLNARIDAAMERADRPLRAVRRSACVLVVIDLAARERPVPDGVTPLAGDENTIASGLRAFADAGADETILVVDPITPDSIRALEGVLVRLDETTSRGR